LEIIIDLPFGFFPINNIILLSRARTNGKMGSRYLAGKKWKTKRFQFIIKLDAVAVVMVVKIVSEMAAANECNR